MTSLEDSQDLGSYDTETASETSIGDRLDLEHTRKAAAYIVSPSQLSESAPAVLEPNLLRPSTSYILTRSEHLESNVDCWIESFNENERNRRRDGVGVQRSVLAERRGPIASFWYLLALLPVINVRRGRWCSPSNSLVTLLNLVDILAVYLKQVVSTVRMKISGLAIDQILHDCFVAAMDFALALHAFVFLVLSVYQDSL